MNEEEANSIFLLEDQEQVLFGTLLGDGSLKKQKNFKNARFQMKHSLKQKEWFDWKVKQLELLASFKCVFYQKEASSKTQPSKLYEKLRFQTRALLYLTKVYDSIYTNNVLDFTKPWVHKLKPIALMVWWLDDGSIMKSKRRGKLATQGFTLDQNKQLQALFKKKWNIDVSICSNYSKKAKKSYNYLQFNTSNLKKLLKLIMPYIPIKSMVYKTLIIYKDKKLQKDWISTMRKYYNPKLYTMLLKFQFFKRKKRIFLKKKFKKVNFNF